MVDGSWSIGAENFEQIRQFLFTLVDSFDVSPDHVRIGLVQYSDNPLTEFLLNTFENKDDILNNIIKLPYRGGGTMTGKGLEFMSNEHFVGKAGSRAAQKVPQIAVVITDGKSQDDVESHAKNLRRRGIVLYAIGVIIFAIGVGDVNQQQLESIVNLPAHHFLYTIDSYQALQRLTDTAKLADFVFIVDESGSIGSENFDLVRSFLLSIVSGFDVGDKRVRVGIVTYSDQATALVYLNNFNETDSLLNFIKILPYRGGGTNTGAALDFTRKNIFTEDAGSRKDKGVQQVAVVITDGESQDNVTEAAAALRRAGVTVFSIGVEGANKKQLEVMAGQDKARVFYVDNFDALEKLYKNITEVLCNSTKPGKQLNV
uniref:VWFA domain-containing protein n=1 Tax=Maylandia zebra TaxID=106582 RepID=A0A3P9C6A4_9CICH